MEYEEKSGDLGTIEQKEVDIFTTEFLTEIDLKIDEIINFFLKNMRLYLCGYNLATPWA